MTIKNLAEITDEEHAAVVATRDRIVVAGKQSEKLKRYAKKHGKTSPKYCDPTELTKTGACTAEECVTLYRLAKYYQPRKILEVGTWFGTTAHVLAMTGAKVYTCDKHDLVVDENKLAIFYHGHSWDFLNKMHDWKHKVDFVWIDALLTVNDIARLLPLLPDTIRFAVHDYEDGEKGMCTMKALSLTLSRQLSIQKEGIIAFTEVHI